MSPCQSNDSQQSTLRVGHHPVLESTHGRDWLHDWRQVHGRDPFSRDWYVLSSTNASVLGNMTASAEGSFRPGVNGSLNYSPRAVDYGTGDQNYGG